MDKALKIEKMNLGNEKTVHDWVQKIIIVKYCKEKKNATLH
jgi:hypothetical protein